MIATLKRFFFEESGNSITEYGAILAFCAIVIGGFILVGNSTLKPAIHNAFSTVTSAVDAAIS